MQPQVKDKVAPLNIRIRADQRRLIEQAAKSTDKTVSDFVRDAALDEAKNALLDQTAFYFTDDAWSEFTAALDAPPTESPRLRDLMSRKPVWKE